MSVTNIQADHEIELTRRYGPSHEIALDPDDAVRDVRASRLGHRPVMGQGARGEIGPRGGLELWGGKLVVSWVKVSLEEQGKGGLQMLGARVDSTTTPNFEGPLHQPPTQNPSSTQSSVGPPQLLEALRALLSAAANRSGSLAPVSALALQHELDRRLLPPSVRESLALLHRIGDIETVGRGFYLPAPTRIVPFTAWGLVLSGLPVQELARLHGLQVVSPGIARLVRDPNAAANIPRCPRASWLRAPRSTIEWAERTIRAAPFQAPHGWEDLEVFNVRKKLGALGWSRITTAHRKFPCTHLARNPQGFGPRTYYFLKIGRRDVEGLGDLHLRGSEIIRLQIALGALADEPFRYSIVSEEGELLVLRLPFLPDPEKLLLECIGTLEVDPRGRGVVARIPSYTQTDVTALLCDLGLVESDGRS